MDRYYFRRAPNNKENIMQQSSQNKNGKYCIVSTTSTLMPALFSLVIVYSCQSSIFRFVCLQE